MLYELLDKLTLHYFDHVVAVSEPLRQEILSAGIAPERCSLIENGLTLEVSRDPEQRALLREELGLGANQWMLLSIGRMDRWKAYEVLLEAFAALEPALAAKLVLVGDGELRQALQEQVVRLGLAARVIMTGYRKDIGRLLGAADLFVISSRKEGLPMILLEAMAAGLPIISTAVGAIPTVIRHGEEGLLVPAEDPERLAQAMVQCLQSPERCRALGQAAHGAYCQRFSRAAMGERYLTLYQSLGIDAQRQSMI
jgi:glycosyltransferase involved in cell wall biosynthesis